MLPLECEPDPLQAVRPAVPLPEARPVLRLPLLCMWLSFTPPLCISFLLNDHRVTAVIRTRLVSLDARKLAEESASLPATQRPRSLSPGWSSGRRPSGQKYLRSDSLMGRSLMDANLNRIRPSSLNSQFSLPYERYQFPESSCHS